MIKVLHVVESFSGGIVQSIATICRALEGEAAFHVLHGRRPDSPEDAHNHYAASVGFTEWANAGRSISPLRDGRAMAALREVVTRIRPDVIHAHSSKAGALARLAYAGGEMPVIYSPRGYSFLQRDKGAMGRTAFWLAERALGVLPHVTVGCGLGEYSLARSVASRAVLIPNMIDPNCADEARGLRPDLNGPLRIAMAGGIRPQKNFPLFCAIAHACRDSDRRFIWIGDGPIPDGVTVPPNVTITGWVSRPEVLRLMAGCHVYMQTSLWEGLPVALLEGMTLGLAVLAYPAIGNTELVIEGFNGFLCPDAGRFIAGLAILDRDREALAAMGANAQRMVAKNNSVSRIAPRWLSLYRHYRRYRVHG